MDTTKMETTIPAKILIDTKDPDDIDYSSKSFNWDFVDDGEVNLDSGNPYSVL